MDELSYNIAFYILAAMTVASAIGVVTKPNLVHSSFLLALCFIGISGLYVLLQADFLAAVQILVYSGAVAILIVLGLMLTQRSSMENTNQNSGWRRGTLLVCGCLLLVILIVIGATPWHYSSAPAAQDTPSVIAQLLLTDYMVAFETAAVLLLAAMMGAIALAKGGKEE